jgi:hypothetical protein
MSAFEHVRENLKKIKKFTGANSVAVPLADLRIPCKAT